MRPPDPITCVITKSITHQLPDVNDVRIIAEMFGLPRSISQSLYDGLKIGISPGQIIAIVGPSGAGKSVLLNEIAAGFPSALRLPHRSVARSSKPALTILRGGSLAAKLKTLSICGLADAYALVTPAKLLSGGQQYRLALAAALHKAWHAGVAAVPSASSSSSSPRLSSIILADEFAACLDMPTAYLLCRQIRRLITPATPIAIILATPRPELLDALAPDKIIIKPLQAQATIIVPKKRKP